MKVKLKLPKFMRQKEIILLKIISTAAYNLALFWSRVLSSSAVRAAVVLVPLFLMSLASLFRPEIIDQSRDLLGKGHAISVGNFHSERQSPVHIDLPNYGDRSSVHITLSFKAENAEAFPNLFQTAGINAGLRAELHGKTLALIYSTSDNSSSTPVGVVVSNTVELGRWYTLNVTARNGGDLTASLSGDSSLSMSTVPPFIAFNNILLGAGFNEDRVFIGEIRDFRIKITKLRPAVFGFAAYLLLRLGLFSVFVLTMIMLFKQTSPNAVGQPNHGIINSKTAAMVIPSAMHDPLLGLRGLAFIMVLLGHWFLVVFPPSDANAFWPIAGSPWGGVWVFFTLSGYLMGKGFCSFRYSADLVGFSKFYRNRALRILPIYYVAIILVGVLICPQMFNLQVPAAAFSLISVLLFDNQGASPIGALWSVSTEVQFYIIVPFMFLLLRPFLTSLMRIFTAIFCVVFCSAYYKYYIMTTMGMGNWHQFVYMPFAVNIDLFTIGLLTAFMSQIVAKRDYKIPYGMAIGFITVAAMYLGISFWSNKAMLGNDGDVRNIFLSIGPITTSLASAVAIFVFENAHRKTPSQNLFVRTAWATSGNLGILTYALYTWHEPILISIRAVAPSKISMAESILYFFYTLPALLAISYLFYRQVELPFDRLKHARTIQDSFSPR